MNRFATRATAIWVRGFLATSALTLAILALVSSFQVSSAAILPDDGTLAFSVWRDGDEIGTHEITFHYEGEAFYVEILTKIAVDFSFVTLYNFDYDGQEIWRAGQLREIHSRSDNDGIEHELDAFADGDALRVFVDGVEGRTQTATLPANLWSLDAMQETSLLNGLDGTEMQVVVEDMGPTTIEGPDGAIETRHFSITGDLRRELWYDNRGLLVRMRLWGKDDSEVNYVLE